MSSRKIRIAAAIVGLVLGAGLALPPVRCKAGEPAAAGLSAEEKQKLLGAETPEHKKLRAELVELAKASGQRIFYNSNFDGHRQQIYAVQPDGSDFACLTPRDWTEGQDYPHAFPDGRKLVFHSDRKVSQKDCLKLPSDPRFLIKDRKRYPPKTCAWTMNVDGSDARPVALDGGCPHVSASGKYLTYCVRPTPNNKWVALLDLAAGKEFMFQAAGNSTTAITPDDKYFVSGANAVKAYSVQDILAGEMKPKIAGKFGAIGCNQEVTPDGKWVVHVIDWKDGSGLFRTPMDIEKGGKDEGLNLGWPRDTDNYFPDVNPDCRYMVYSHWKTGAGDKDRYSTAAADLYVTRWPPDGVSVRITWHGGTTQNPHWWGSRTAAR